MHIRLTQIYGKLPNLALMKLAHYHRTARVMSRPYRDELRHLPFIRLLAFLISTSARCNGGRS
jgi:hypothetical protein